MADYVFSVKFVKSLRSSVLFTAVTYCSLSLSSILFTDIEINVIVIIYTCFATALILFILLSTDFMIEHRRRMSAEDILEQVNKKINESMFHIINESGNDTEHYEKFQRMTEIKVLLEHQMHNRFDVQKILYSIGLLLITVIPVILQWILDSFI